MNPLKKIVLDAKKKHQPLDLHLHTRFSVDVINGNSFEEYMQAGEAIGIVPGFLDHFQAEKVGDKRYPFHEENVTNYFNAYETAKETGLRSFLGLEIDYYSPELHGDWNRITMEWLDRHKKEFDYLVGTVHDVFEGTITIPAELDGLLKTHSFPEIDAEYYHVLDRGIELGGFHGFAHLDVVYRFCGDKGVLPGKKEYYTDERTVAGMAACTRHDIVIELNLRGFDHPWNSTYPAEPLFQRFKDLHPKAAFFTGSDSHDVKTFERYAPVIRRYTERLNT
nr:PHP domain-containing protein [Candidatus Sigynarchaeota archaeon]